MGEFSASVKFTKCLYEILATLASFLFAIGEYIFSTTKGSMFTNLQLWTLFILACTAFKLGHFYLQRFE